MKVVIYEEEYKKLLDIKTRVDVVVGQIMHNEYLQREQVLRILGTKEAVKYADELKAEDGRMMEEAIKEYAERQQEIKEEQQDDKYHAGG